LSFKERHIARHQWLRPVILATQEAEIRRIRVQSQLWANSSPDPISKKSHHKGGVVSSHTSMDKGRKKMISQMELHGMQPLEI
jgi:hypothetical protein